MGYGDRVERPTISLVNVSPMGGWVPVKASSIREEMQAIRERGRERGVNPGILGLEQYFRLIHGQLNVLSGIPSHGKTEVMENIEVCTAAVQGWRWLTFAPETFPLDIQVQKLGEKFLGKRLEVMTERDVDSYLTFLDRHFEFLPVRDEDTTLANVFCAIDEVMKLRKIDGVVIDPWNELESGRPSDMSETDYIGECLKNARKFARSRNLSFWIVAHPTKILKDPKTLKYPVPTMYQISGSAHWYNKADNGIVVHRDFDDDFTEIHVQKVKNRYYGKVGTLKLKYDNGSGRYRKYDIADEFEFTRPVSAGDLGD